MIVVGDERGLRFRLAWERPAASGTAAEATRGEVAAWIGDTLVWGGEEGGDVRGLCWSWIEMLEHLANAWPYLEWEQVNPLGLDVFPDRLRTVAEERWVDLSPERRDTQEQALFEYEQSHNLAAGLQGIFPDPLWIQRNGACAWIISDGVRCWRPFDETIRTLEAFGEAIFKRLRPIKSEPRARAAMESWSRRRQMPLDQYVSLATGLSPATIASLVGRREAREAFAIREAGEENEILAAARMIGTALPAHVLRRVFERIRKEERHSTPELDELSNQALAHLDTVINEPAHDQGTTLARWLRERLEVGDAEPIDPFDVLKTWKVRLIEMDLSISSIDAIGCWGPRHGPVVFLNRSGRHCSSRGGRNATVAHEICHLLIDRDRALPLVEAVGGRVPPVVEPRARAFAAELLVPGSAAAEIAGVGAKQLKRAVARLARRYGASRELVAWRVRNSGAPLQPSHVAYLKSLVGEPWRF